MMPKFNSTSKDLIRSVWAKNLLDFLSTNLDSKLIYLGLPGEEAKDIEEWIEFLDKVFAFQNEDDRYPDAYKNLMERLNLLEQTNKLSTYNVFNGFIEKVVTQGIDEQDNDFDLNEVVTLYNLDFCNQIDFPIEVQIPVFPYVKEIFKFDAIDRLLEIQNSLGSSIKRFILYLTIHCSYKDRNTINILNTQIYRDYLVPKNNLLKGQGHYKNAYALRKFVLRNLISKFNLYSFECEILPTIYYEGDNGTPMLFFTFIGRNGNILSDDDLETQLTSCLNKKFISILDEDFINLNIEPIVEDDNALLNPVIYFQETEFFKTKW